MKSFIILIIVFISAQGSAKDSSCLNPVSKSCEFYKSCLEEQTQCGTNGYAIGYGYKYCNKFLSYDFTPNKGEIWVESTLLCLQKELSPIISNAQSYNCNEIKTYAFDSHPTCYLDPIKKDPSVSVCWLPLKDLIQIFNVIDLADLVSKNALKQEKVVAITCTKRLWKRWFKGLKTLEKEDVYLEKMNFFEDLASREN